MSRGSKIYKRFGFKFALAYRVRKIKTRVLGKTFVQSLLMLYQLLEAQKDSKTFGIYRTLRQQNVLIVNPKHLRFILCYYGEILEWLNSKEYQEQYLKTNHPYPPLLNPKRLAKDSENPYIIDSKILESMNLNLTKEMHNLTLSYETIPAELAWEMNLPLPLCDMVKFENHGSGGAMNVFLDKIGIVCVVNSGVFRARNEYCRLFRGLIKGARAVVLRDFRTNLNDIKLYSLVQKPRIMVLNQVRDPVSNLKSLINYSTKMHQKPLCEDNFDDYYLTNLCNTQFYNALVCLKGEKIEFMDMSEIVGERTLETLNRFAKIFDVSPIEEAQKEFYTTKQVNSKNIVSEDEMLKYFRSHKKVRDKVKRMLDSHLELIKSHRPDIVESWKYYQAFEKMCKEMEK